MDTAIQEKLNKFEKANRKLVALGYIFLVLIVFSWFFFALNASKATDFILRPGQNDRLMIQRMEKEFTPQSEREEKLLEMVKGLIIMSTAMIKILTIGFVQTILMVIGLIAIGFARYQGKLLNLVKNL